MNHVLTEIDTVFEQLDEALTTLWALRNRARLDEDIDAEMTYLDTHDTILDAVKLLKVPAPVLEIGETTDEVEESDAGANEDATFGAWLFDVMQARGTTVGELARLSGLAEATINRIISGETVRPQTGTIERLTRALA
jgi:DNA-binding Xre family transcriptional regulator